MATLCILWFTALFGWNKLSAELACSFWRMEKNEKNMVGMQISSAAVTKDDCFRLCYKMSGCKYIEYENDSCDLFTDDNAVQHTFRKEAYVIGRGAEIDESCERDVVLDEPRLDGLSTATERDLLTSSSNLAESTFAGPELTTVPAYELLGWEYYHETNMCYKKFRVAGGGNQDVKESEKNCTGYGGNLASIHSAAQNNFLQQMLPITPCVIGLKFVENQCGVAHRYWSDSSVVNFENWEPGEPNNNMCEQFCTYLQSDGTWNNYRCDANSAFVCETDNIVYCPQRRT
ncbi:hypothetical protein RB195_008522 [Necator americanus]|uniref:C-type lectin domain-containing protein n=1 Tax=Necator americanus TaxID=51031 RepID=A0ABR1CQA7_NECAM